MRFKKVVFLIVCAGLIFSSSTAISAEGEEDIITKTLEIPVRLVEGVLGFDLGKIIITPTKYEKRLGEVTVSSAVVDGEDIEKGDFCDVSEVLDRVNSLRIERYGSPGQVATPVIRGMTSARVLVLVDGIPYDAPSTGVTDLSKFPVSAIDRIEVVRGPNSSLYGADAVGGVINIITKDVPEEPKAHAAYSFGSWNTHDVTIENGATYGKLGYNVVTNYQSTGGERGESDHGAFDLNSRIKLTITDEVDYTFQTAFYTARTEHPGVRPPLSRSDWTPSQSELGDEGVSSRFDYTTTNRARLNSVLNIKNFSLQHYLVYWDDDDHRESINGSNQKITDQDEYRTYIYGMEAKYVQPIMDIDTVTIGTTLTRKKFKTKTHQYNDDTKVHTFSGQDPVRREWSIYAENELKLYPFTVVFGLRRDDPSDFSIRWSPKISGMVDLGFDTKLKASYGRAYRAPTLNDIHWPATLYAQGNQNLRPEKTKAFEIGVEKLFGDLFLGRATYFTQRTKNKIVWSPTGPIIWAGLPYRVWQPDNVNSSSTKGVELEARFNLLDKIETTLDYTYLDAEEKITSGGQEYRRKAELIPAHKVGAGFSWQDPFDVKGITISSFLRYVSDRRRFFTTSDKKIEDGYFIWDAKILYRYKDNINLFLAIDNILDEGYAKFGSGADDRGYPQPGLSVTGGIDVTY